MQGLYLPPPECEFRIDPHWIIRRCQSRGKALGLDWKHVNVAAGTTRIQQALVLTGNDNTAVVHEMKTPKSRRTLYIDHDVLVLLQSLQRSKTTGLVFTTSNGTPIHPRNLVRSFKRLIALAGLDRSLRVHDLRHTWASLALQRGVPVELVSERLGHANVSITLNTYRHLYDAERREAALSLRELIGSSARSIN